MWAVIGIFKAQKFIDQFVSFQNGEHLIAFYSGFTGGRGNSLGDQFRRLI